MYFSAKANFKVKNNVTKKYKINKNKGGTLLYVAQFIKNQIN